MLGRGFKVRLTTGADLDFTDAQLYHDSISAELANRFYDRTIEALNNLTQFWNYEKGPGGLRKYQIPGFKYFLIYSVDESAGEILVEGLFHGHSSRIPYR